MTLAMLNEFWTEFPRIIFDIPIMVITHGLINAAIAVPCFFYAVSLEK